MRNASLPVTHDAPSASYAAPSAMAAAASRATKTVSFDDPPAAPAPSLPAVDVRRLTQRVYRACPTCSSLHTRRIRATPNGWLCEDGRTRAPGVRLPGFECSGCDQRMHITLPPLPSTLPPAPSSTPAALSSPAPVVPPALITAVTAALRVAPAPWTRDTFGNAVDASNALLTLAPHLPPGAGVDIPAAAFCDDAKLLSRALADCVRVLGVEQARHLVVTAIGVPSSPPPATSPSTTEDPLATLPGVSTGTSSPRRLRSDCPGCGVCVSFGLRCISGKWLKASNEVVRDGTLAVGCPECCTTFRVTLPRCGATSRGFSRVSSTSADGGCRRAATQTLVDALLSRIDSHGHGMMRGVLARHPARVEFGSRAEHALHADLSRAVGERVFQRTVRAVRRRRHATCMMQGRAPCC